MKEIEKQKKNTDSFFFSFLVYHFPLQTGKKKKMMMMMEEMKKPESRKNETRSKEVNEGQSKVIDLSATSSDFNFLALSSSEEDDELYNETNYPNNLITRNQKNEGKSERISIDLGIDEIDNLITSESKVDFFRGDSDSDSSIDDDDSSAIIKTRLHQENETKVQNIESYKKDNTIDVYCSLCKHKINVLNGATTSLPCSHKYHLRCFSLMSFQYSSKTCCICFRYSRFDNLIIRHTYEKNKFDRISFSTTDFDDLCASVASRSFEFDSEDLKKSWKKMEEIGDAVNLASQNNHYMVDMNDKKTLAHRALSKSSLEETAVQTIKNALETSNTAKDLIKNGVDITIIQRSKCGIDLLIEACQCDAKDFESLGFKKWADLVELGIKPEHLMLRKLDRNANQDDFYQERLFEVDYLIEIYGHNFMTIIDFIASCRKGESLPNEIFNREAIYFFCVELDYNTKEYYDLGLRNLDRLANYGRRAFDSTTYVHMCMKIIEMKKESINDYGDIHDSDTNFYSMSEIKGEIVGPYGHSGSMWSEKVGITSVFLFDRLKISQRDLEEINWKLDDLSNLFGYRILLKPKSNYNKNIYKRENHTKRRERSKTEKISIQNDKRSKKYDKTKKNKKEKEKEKKIEEKNEKYKKARTRKRREKKKESVEELIKNKNYAAAMLMTRMKINETTKRDTPTLEVKEKIEKKIEHKEPKKDNVGPMIGNDAIKEKTDKIGEKNRVNTLNVFEEEFSKDDFV